MSESDTITIAGFEFNVPVRYTEGHQLTAGEASALNQTFHENLRNNFASKVKAATKDLSDGEEFDTTELQTSLDEYADAYQFGVRTAGVRVSADPVKREAISLAKAAIRKALSAKGRKATPEAIATAAEQLLAGPKGETYMQVARERIEAAKAVADETLDDIVSEVPDAPVAEEAAAA